MCNVEGHCHLCFGIQKLVIGLEEGGGGGLVGVVLAEYKEWLGGAIQLEATEYVQY